MAEIMQWNDIKGDFKGALLVGNGGSIALSDNFSYKSLYGYADKHDLLQKEAIAVFDKFYKKDRDFERVLYRLWQADYINQKFKVAKDERDKVHKGYLKVRLSLINAVKDIHPPHSSLQFDLPNVGKFISGFKTIFSLNYDLMLYWATQKVNERKRNRIKDGFNTPVNLSIAQKNRTFEFSSDIDLLRKPFRDNDSSTMVFYPHGSLLLYQTRSRKDERKIISATEGGLLKTITDFWSRNKGNPIFVCEGDSDRKLEAISGSKYLTHVYQNELPRTGDTLTIYGWGIGGQDAHIVKQLAKGRYKKIAMSIYTQNKSPIQLDREMDEYLNKLKKIVSPEHVQFFDAASDGCWKY
jgi:hypothetical protein